MQANTNDTHTSNLEDVCRQVKEKMEKIISMKTERARNSLTINLPYIRLQLVRMLIRTFLFAK